MTLARRHLLNDDFEDAVRVGELAARVAEEVGADEARAGALMNIGAGRLWLGDVDAGAADMDRAIALAREIRSFHLGRGLGMRRDQTFELGDLARSGEILSEGLREAERFGMTGISRWLRGERAVERYHTGAWDDACELIREVLGDQPWWFDPEALRVRALIHLARGDHRGALEDADLALERAREGLDPQVLYPALIVRALVLLTVEDQRAAEAHVDELLSHLRLRRRGLARASWVVEFARVLTSLGREDEFATALSEVGVFTPWSEAAHALASGSPDVAAELFARIGSRPCEALASMRAGELLAATGRRAEADIHLHAAAAFWKCVGADAYLRDTEARLAAAS